MSIHHKLYALYFLLLLVTIADQHSDEVGVGGSGGGGVVFSIYVHDVYSFI